MIQFQLYNLFADAISTLGVINCKYPAILTPISWQGGEQQAAWPSAPMAQLPA